MSAGPFYGKYRGVVVQNVDPMLIGRVQAGELKPGAKILLECMWKTHRDPAVVVSYMKTVEALLKDGFEVYEVPLEDILQLKLL